ncbi:MAG: TRAP transporter small permease [Dethiobacteria bacterium]|jgi:TRAP-type C4-dicarboxylate transport system permease small subunit
MEWLVTVQKKVQRIIRIVSTISMFVLIPMMLLTTADIITRTAFKKPISGAVEMSSFMLLIVILLGLAYTQQVKGHPRVTIFVSRFPARAQFIVEVFVNLLCLFIVGIIVWQGWAVAKGDTGRIVSDVLRIPQFPFRLLVPFGGAFLFLEFIFDFLVSINKLLKS